MGLIVETDRLIDRLRDALNTPGKWVGVSNHEQGWTSLAALLAGVFSTKAADVDDVCCGSFDWVDQGYLPRGRCHALILPGTDAVRGEVARWARVVLEAGDPVEDGSLLVLSDGPAGHAWLTRLMAGIAVRGGKVLPDVGQN